MAALAAAAVCQSTARHYLPLALSGAARSHTVIGTSFASIVKIEEVPDRLLKIHTANGYEVRQVSTTAFQYRQVGETGWTLQELYTSSYQSRYWITVSNDAFVVVRVGTSVVNGVSTTNCLTSVRCHVPPFPRTMHLAPVALFNTAVASSVTVVDGVIYALGIDSLMKSVDGTSWSSSYVGSFNPNAGGFITSDLMVVSPASGTSIRYSTNKGASWGAITVPNSPTYVEIIAAADKMLVVYCIVAGVPVIYITPDLGSTWHTYTPPVYGSFNLYSSANYAATIASDRSVYLLQQDSSGTWGGLNSVVRKTSDYTTWTSIQLGIAGHTAFGPLEITSDTLDGSVWVHDTGWNYGLRSSTRLHLTFEKTLAGVAITCNPGLRGTAYCRASIVTNSVDVIDKGASRFVTVQLPTGELMGTPLTWAWSVMQDVDTPPKVYRLLSSSGATSTRTLYASDDGVIVIDSAFDPVYVGYDTRYGYTIPGTFDGVPPYDDVMIPKPFGNAYIMAAAITTDNGTSWHTLPTKYPIIYATDSWAVGIRSSDNTQHVTSDFVSWTALSSTYKVIGASRKALYLGQQVSPYNLYRSYDGGVTRIQVFVGVSPNEFYEPMDGVLIGYKTGPTPVCYVSTDDGASYSTISVPAQGTYTGRVPNTPYFGFSLAYDPFDGRLFVATAPGIPATAKLRASSDGYISGTGVGRSSAAETKRIVQQRVSNPNITYDYLIEANGMYVAFGCIDMQTYEDYLIYWSADLVSWERAVATTRYAVNPFVFANQIVVRVDQSSVLVLDMELTTITTRSHGMGFTTGGVTTYVQGDYLYAVNYMYRGVRYRTTDLVTWTRVANDDDASYYLSIFVADDGTMYGQTTNLSFAVSYDVGHTWIPRNRTSAIASVATTVDIAIHPNGTIVSIVGNTVSTSINDGVTWFDVSKAFSVIPTKIICGGDYFVACVVSTGFPIASNKMFASKNGFDWFVIDEPYTTGLSAPYVMLRSPYGSTFITTRRYINDGTNAMYTAYDLLIEEVTTYDLALDSRAYFTSSVTCAPSAQATISEARAEATSPLPQVHMTFDMRVAAIAQGSTQMWGWLKARAAFTGASYATATGGLSLSALFRSSVVTNASTTATLTLPKALAASANCVATATAGNTIYGAALCVCSMKRTPTLLTHTSAELSSTVGAIASSNPPLAFVVQLASTTTADGTWVVGASLTTTIMLAADTLACSTDVSTPSLATVIKLESVAANDITVTAPLTASISLAATATCTPLASAPLAHDELRSTQAVVTLATGNLTHIVRLESVNVEQCVATGDLSAQINLASVVQLSCLSSGTTSVQAMAEATVSTTSTATATLRVSIGLQASALAQTYVLLDATGQIKLVGTATVSVNALLALIRAQYPDKSAAKTYVNVPLRTTNAVYIGRSTKVFIAE